MSTPLIKNGLVAYYSFDGDVKDYNGNNGTIKGDVKFVEGVSGQAIAFTSPSSNVVIDPIYLSNNFSISFWIEPSKNINQNNRFLSSNKSGRYYFDCKKNYIRIRSGGPVSKGSSYTIQKENLFQPGFNHIVYIQNGENNYFYINGKQIEGELVGEIKDYEIHWFNNDEGDTRWGIKSPLDEVYIFNRALNEDEVKTLYNLNPVNSKGKLNIMFSAIETTPNIDIEIQDEKPVFINDMIYTDYEKEENTNSTFTINNSKYKFADVFILGENLNIENKTGSGIFYFLKQKMGKTFNISGNIKKNIIVYHNGYWSDIN